MLSDDEAHDQLLQMWMAVTAGPVIVAAVLVYLRRECTEWALRHGVLVSDEPLMAIPGADGAGLDGPRLMILFAVVVVLVTIGFVSVRRQLEKGRRIE